MQGALGYYWLQGLCNKHFVTLSKKGAFFGRGSSINTKRFVSGCGNFLFQRKNKEQMDVK
jgi:hypothetical protein